MASKYAMETVFQLIDKVSRPLDKIGIKSKAVSKKLQKDFVAAQKRLDNLGKAVAKWGKRAALAIAAAATAWVGMGVKNALTLADTMARIGHAANITGPPLIQMQKDLTDVANKAGLAVNELASIANTSILSGVAVEGAAEFAAVVAKTAKITETSSDQIVDGLTTVMNAYGMSADESARISGMMINANRFGKTSFQDMASGMKNVIPHAAALGIATEEVFASITTLTAKGLTTKDAMKTLGDSFSAIKRPSKDAAALAQRLGIDFSEAALRSKGFAGFMEDVRQKTGGNTRILETLFGNEKIARSISILTTSGAEAFSEALDIMKNSLETVDTEFARVTDTPAERWKKAVNKIQNAGTSLGTTILPVVERVIGKITEIADRLASVDFSQYSGTIDMVFSKIEGLIGVIIWLVKTAWNLRYVIGAVVGIMAVYHGALMVAALYTKTFAVWQGIAKAYTFANTLATQGQAAALATLKAGTIAYNIVSKAFAKGEKIKAFFLGLSTGAITAKSIATGILTGVTGVWATVTGVATTAQTALNVALTANPIGVIIMAVAAVIALLVILIKNFKKITAWVKSNTEKVMLFFTILYGPIGIVISMIKELVSNWQNIKNALAGAGLFDAIKKIGTSIKDFIKPAIDWLIGVWEKVKAAVSGFFITIGNAVKNFFTPVINWITGIWQTVSTAVIGVFKRIWDAVSTFLQPIFSWIAETWQKIVSFFQNNAIINAIKVIGGTLISGILAPIQGLLEILSNIPGLGRLAGKGADKIQQLRNNLTGRTEQAVPETPAEQLAPIGNTPQAPTTPDVNYPDLNVPGVNTGGTGSGSRLHGVVDVSGGARAPVIPNLSEGSTPGTYTVNQAVSTPSVSVPDAIAAAASGVTSVLREILASTKAIEVAIKTPVPEPPAAGATAMSPVTLQADTATAAPGTDTVLIDILAAARSIDETTIKALTALEAPATITLAVPPAVPPQAATAPFTGSNVPQRPINTGRGERERADGDNPRNIPPVTSDQRMAYSLQENRETLGIEVAAAQGTEARVVRRPRSPNIHIINSGGNA